MHDRINGEVCTAAPEAPRVVANSPPATAIPPRQSAPATGLDKFPVPTLPAHTRMECETPPMFEEEPDLYNNEPSQVPRYALRLPRNQLQNFKAVNDMNGRWDEGFKLEIIEFKGSLSPDGFLD